MFIAVTGASGHLGANVVRTLLQHGHRVRAIVHHHTRGIDSLPVELATADVLNLKSLQTAFDGSDMVIHLASRISIVPWDSQQTATINTTGVENVVTAYLSSRVKRLVHVSSIHSHEKAPRNQELDETRPLVRSRNTNIYDSSKASGERIVQSAIKNGLDAVIINPTGIIGPYDFEPSLLGAGLLTIARRNIPITIGGGFDWVDARDVAEGILQAAVLAPPGGKYLLSGHWVAMHDVAREVYRVMGKKLPLFSFPLWGGVCIAPVVTAFNRVSGRRALFTPAAVNALNSNKMVSHAKASSVFGYNPRPFADTIRDTLTWFRMNGFLR